MAKRSLAVGVTLCEKSHRLKKKNCGGPVSSQLLSFGKLLTFDWEHIKADGGGVS